MCTFRISAFGFWFGLELGRGLAVVVLNSNRILENEASCKFYLVQGISWIGMFLGLIILIGQLPKVVGRLSNEEVALAIIGSRLCLKTGIFPLHF